MTSISGESGMQGTGRRRRSKRLYEALRGQQLDPAEYRQGQGQGQGHKGIITEHYAAMGFLKTSEAT